VAAVIELIRFPRKWIKAFAGTVHHNRSSVELSISKSPTIPGLISVEIEVFENAVFALTTDLPQLLQQLFTRTHRCFSAWIFGLPEIGMNGS
jgi:hypothetical protein